MTEVLSIPQHPNHANHESYNSQSRRAVSQPSLFLQNSQSYATSNPYYRSKSDDASYEVRLPLADASSAPSSAPSSPSFNQLEFSRQPSYLSTPSSSLSFQDHAADEDDNYFPCYDTYEQVEPSIETEAPAPLPSPESLVDTPSTEVTTPLSSALSRSSLYDPESTTGDDTAMRSEPTRHVDYLSHTWKEEDIWASWRHIVSGRKQYGNGMRLENASWRTWAKSKYRLKTMSPEDLNWMKDHDVTWLYGPLQIAPCHPSEAPVPLSQMSRCNSFGTKKTILKKRSVSEAMLQRSLSSSTLMKQATDALRAQQLEKATGNRATFNKLTGDLKVSDFISLSGDETPVTRANTHAVSSDPSSSTSGIQTPSTTRHIHFNEQVEQCIAINCETHDESTYHVHSFADDSDSSEDELLIMAPVSKRSRSRRRVPSTPRPSFSNEGVTIARLPATTLNCRGGTPEPDEHVQQQRSRLWNPGPGTPYLPTSSSEQTLRPTSPSPKREVDDEDDADMDWQPSAGRRGSIFPQGGYRITQDSDEDEDENPGMKRTPSGMFMPYDEDEGVPRDGILGKVVDTVNTAKDIAHVIWNVGWRGN